MEGNRTNIGMEELHFPFLYIYSSSMSILVIYLPNKSFYVSTCFLVTPSISIGIRPWVIFTLDY